MRTPSMRHRIVPLLQWPLTLSVALMAALFAESRASCSPDHDFLLRDHHWMAAFWVVHCAALIYLGTLNTWVALILRHDPRSRPVSRAWLIGLALGACGIVGFALPWLNVTGWYDWSRRRFLVEAACRSVPRTSPEGGCPVHQGISIWGWSPVIVRATTPSSRAIACSPSTADHIAAPRAPETCAATTHPNPIQSRHRTPRTGHERGCCRKHYLPKSWCPARA